MAASPYRVTPARIVNSSGLRLPAAFYRDHPQFSGAGGQVKVLADNILLMRLEASEPQEQESKDESLILGLCLDFLSREALVPEVGAIFYTEAMATEDEDLLAGVAVDSGDEAVGP